MLVQGVGWALFFRCHLLSIAILHFSCEDSLQQHADILGVAVDADEDQIHRAYRRLAARHHPDQGGDREAFQKIQHAYDQLLLGRKRAIRAAMRQSASTEGGDARQTRKTSSADGRRSSTGKSTQASEAARRRARQPPPARSAKPPGAAPTGTRKSAETRQSTDHSSLRTLLTGHLPLQSETSAFILVNVLDIYMTYWLLTRGAIEANPIADFFYRRFAFNGMIAFKLAIVAAVCVIAQIVATQSLGKARGLLWAGTAIIGAVVLYSAWLGWSKGLLW